MALLRLFLKPGVDKQNTEYGAEGGWVDCDYIRFRYGLPEKLGGWKNFDNVEAYFIGTTSEVFTWSSLSGAPYAAIGTNRKLYAYYGGTWADITPIRYSSTGVTFSTTAGSNIVIVNDPAHGALAGDFVTFSSVTGNPGGIPNASLQNQFQIDQVITANSYQITSPVSASSTVTAGTANAAYQISVGPDKGFSDFGWGIGTWGTYAWGTPRPASAALELFPRVWQFDTYGENLIAQVLDGGVYEWDPSGGLGSRATIVAGAPTKNKYALVSTPDRHLVCFGTETTLGSPSTQDPMFVRFSSQENIGDFVATATNTAGGQRLTDGNTIVSAIRSRGQILIFTDTSLHGQSYVGPPYTFGFQQLGANCGCIAPHAAIDVNGVAYWMGRDAFFVFDGTVKKIPCTVQDYVFKDINLVQGFQVNVGLNAQFNEVTWWYCSFTSDYVDRFVTYNYLENVWSIGSMPRTAWADMSTFDKPIAASYDPDGTQAPTYDGTIYGLTAGRTRLYNQEDGYDAVSDPISAYIVSGYFDIGDGDQMLLMSRFIPDFKNQIGNLTVRLLLRPYPQASASPSSLDPYVIAPGTQKVDTRARGRQIQLRIESDELGGNWRFGTMRVDIQPDGLR